MFQFLLHILITSHIVTSQSPVTIQSPQNVSVCEGGTATFTCVVMWSDGSTPGPATWITNNGINDASREPGHVLTNDYDGRPAPTNVTTILTVTNVSSSNSGSDYECAQGSVVTSATVFLTVFGPPDPVTNLTIPLNMTASTSFLVQWSEPSSNPVCGPVQYIVNVSTGGMVISNDNTSKTNYTVMKLCNNTIYDVNVTTINNAGSSHPETVNITTMNTESGFPFAPNIALVKQLSNTSFIINWTSSDPNYNYTVIWTNLHTGVMYNRTVPENTNNYTVTGLSGDVNYNVSVAAVNMCGMNISDPSVTVFVAPNKPDYSWCISYNDGQPVLQVSTHVIVDVPSMSLMLKFLTSYQTGIPTVTDATCSDKQNNIQYNCTAEFTVDIIPSVEIIQSVNVTVSGPYGSNSSVMEAEQRINAVLDECILNSSHNSTIVKCDLACFSPELECVLYNITTNNTDVTSLIMNTTSNINGSLTTDNYPTQLITLTNLTSGTTYNYCVVAINVTNMMDVGDPVCGTFTTKSLTSDDSCSECYGTVFGIAAGIIAVIVVILALIVLVWCIACRNKTCRISNCTSEEFFDQFVVIGSLVVGVCIIVAVIVVAVCYCVCCKNGDDHFECQECYGAAIAGIVVIVTMIVVGICCCISLSGEYCLCCNSCCNQDEKEKDVYGTKRRVAVEPHIENIDLDTTRYAHIIENPTANQTNVQIFVSDNKSKPQPTGQTHLNRSVEDYEASIVIENPLTEPPESLIPHNTTNGVQYSVSTKLKSTMHQIQRDGVTVDDNTEASSQPEVENATDGDDSEDTTISHPQPDPDTAQQGSTNKEHSTPNDHKQQDEVDSSDRWNEENTNTGSPKIPVTTATHQLTNTSATSSQSGPSSEYAVIQKPTNKKVPHLTVISGDRYALSTHVNSLKRVKHDNNHKQQYEADGTDRRNEENTNAGSPNIPVTTTTHQLTNTSVTSSQSGPSSEYAVIQKPTNKKIPHLTVNSGDKYALSTHVNSLNPVKQQQPTSVHSQVGHSNQKGSAAAGNDNQPH